MSAREPGDDDDAAAPRPAAHEWAPEGGPTAFVLARIAAGDTEEQIEEALRRRRGAVQPSRAAARDTSAPAPRDASRAAPRDWQDTEREDEES